MIILDIVVTLFLFFLFAVSHTFLASGSMKKRLSEKLGPQIAFYRVFYNISSFLILAIVIFIAPKPDIVVYDLQYPFDIITFALQIISLLGLIWAVKFIDIKEFLGISQIERYLQGTYTVGDLDERMIFNSAGAFNLCRHPTYFFSFLFLAFRPTMSFFYAEFVIYTAIYFYIGSIFKERKLIERFGEKYKKYQKRVPRILPIRLRKRY